MSVAKKGSQYIQKGVDIIRIEAPTNRVLFDENDNFDILGEKAYRLKSTAWCAGGYIISKNAAIKLINLDPCFFQPSDFLLFSKEYSPLFNYFKIYQLSPALVLQNKFSTNKTFKSNIEIYGKKKYRHLNLSDLYEKCKNTFLGYKRISSKIK